MKNSENFYWSIKLLVLSLLTLIIQFSSKYQLLPIVNVFIPDSKTYEIRVTENIELNSFSAISYNSLNSLFYEIGSITFVPFNLLLLLLSIRLCDYAVGNLSKESAKYAKCFVVYNPYLLVGIVGPNKETVLVFICLLFWACYFSLKGFKHFLIIIVVLILPFFIRPIVSIVFLCSVIFGHFTKKKYRANKIFTFGLIIYFLLNTIPSVRVQLLEIQGNSSELESFTNSRIHEIAIVLRAFSEDAILQIPAFFTKVILILFTPILRPIAIFSFPLPFLDIGYCILAYMLFPFNLGVIYLYFKGSSSSGLYNTNIELLILFVLVGIFTTVNNSNITFRYLYPYGPFIFALFSVINQNVQRLVTYLSVCCIFVALLISFYFRNPYVVDDYSSVVPIFLDWF